MLKLCFSNDFISKEKELDVIALDLFPFPWLPRKSRKVSDESKTSFDFQILFLNINYFFREPQKMFFREKTFTAFQNKS